MSFVLSSISGNLISAASAGYAPTNSGDVSAIASAYQVVSSTATQLYAGTSYLTGVNAAPISADRAGHAANASLANSAWYDGTGRLISALPDSADVSAIASAYAESAASSKLDASSSSSFYTTANESGFLTTAYSPTFGYDSNNLISSIDGSALAGGGDYVENSALESADGYSASGSKTTGISSISGQPLIPKVIAPNAYQGHQQKGYAVLMPTAAPFGTASGVYTPLQGNPSAYASLALSAQTQRGYLAGNNLFISDSNGVIQVQVSNNRGIRIYGSSNNSASGFAIQVGSVNGQSNSSTQWRLGGNGVSGKSGEGSEWQYGSSEYNQLTSVHDTVSANSASWGQVTGMSSYVPYSSIGYNTASAISGINGSALAGTTYSAGTGIDITDDVISVEAPVDIVAGPGIVIDNPDGNTLRVSSEYDVETVLFEDTGTNGTVVSSVVLSETASHFSTLEITLGWAGGGSTPTAGRLIFRCNTDGNYYGFGGFIGADASSHFILGGISANGTTLGLKNVIDMYSSNLTGVTYQSFNNILKVFKVVGINRIAGGN